jgi:hypothetical protein
MHPVKKLYRPHTLIWICLLVLVYSCKKKPADEQPPDTTPEPKLHFVFRFDSTQVRLNNLGQPSTIPEGHAAQSPKFNKISAHYLELSPSSHTPLGNGTVLYRASETTTGGGNAIDFEKSVLVGEAQAFVSIPLRTITPGSYEWVRVSLAYQNYNIAFKTNVDGTNFYLHGTLASFVGFNTYIKNYRIQTKEILLNENKAQGYWGFETAGGITLTGQAPAGATTVPNPLASTSPIPAGSCVVTGKLEENLVISGSETKDITIVLSLSTNNSFEWEEVNADGWFEPTAGEQIVDMGLRGVVPIVVR